LASPADIAATCKQHSNVGLQSELVQQPGLAIYVCSRQSSAVLTDGIRHNYDYMMQNKLLFCP